MPGRLSLVATPIGNLEDITLRALRVLREADVILAEDTRQTKKLCARHEIATQLQSFHAHSRDEKVDAIVDALREGAHYALVSDAGTPVVSDPGAYLVSRAASEGVTVDAIPGPSAVLAALCVAGIPLRRFVFEGFLPRGGKERRVALQRVAASTAAVVLFESPHRIHATLRDLEAEVGDARRVAVCRELTKLHEETLRGTIPEVCAALSDPTKGEITVVLEGRADVRTPEEVDVGELVLAWQREGLGTKAMTQRLQQEHGWKRNDAYQAVLDALGHDDLPD